MNKRQKKKFIKKNMIKLKKIHPDEGDVVIIQFDPGNEYIDIDTVVMIYNAWNNSGFLNKCAVAISPCNVKVWDKEAAQKYCDAFQEVINEMDNDKK